MQTAYGEGQYTQGDIRCHGRIIVDTYKLYLQGPQGELTQSFVSLDKICRLQKGRTQVTIDVRLSQANQYRVALKMEPIYIKDLIEDLVRKLNLKKKWLRPVWVGEVISP
jgi:hypothetical protein